MHTAYTHTYGSTHQHVVPEGIVDDEFGACGSAPEGHEQTDTVVLAALRRVFCSWAAMKAVRGKNSGQVVLPAQMGEMVSGLHAVPVHWDTYARICCRRLSSVSPSLVYGTAANSVSTLSPDIT
jgi:hypothetical protein